MGARGSFVRQNGGENPLTEGVKARTHDSFLTSPQRSFYKTRGMRKANASCDLGCTLWLKIAYKIVVQFVQM